MKKIVGILTLLLILAVLTGCWDNHELDTLFIVTGIGLDTTEAPEKMNVSLQVGKPAGSTGKTESSSSEESFLVLKTEAKTMAEALLKLNRDSSRTMLLQHNQLVLFSSDFAEQGLKNHIDFFVRDYESRLEVLVMIAEGNAEEVLNSKMPQDKMSGSYLSRLMRNHEVISPHFRVIMLDLFSRMVDETSSALIPLIELTQEDEKSGIQMTGMGIIKNGRMIGRLDNDRLAGYIWTMGDVKKWTFEVDSPMGKATFGISELSSKKNININEADDILIEVPVHAELTLTEVNGFSGYDPQGLLDLLKILAEKQFHDMMMDTFNVSREYRADFYWFGNLISKKHPKKWESMKENWDEIYAGIDFVPKVNVHIGAVGQIVKSVEMEDQENEN